MVGFIFSFTQAQAVEWKGVFVAGDHSIDNFDNGRIDLTQAFSLKGTLSSIQLSSSEKFISQESSVYPATSQNLVAAFQALKLQNQNEGCLIHMTSHGIQNQGFYLSRAGVLDPSTFNQLVNKACGDAPTVVMVSACFSGQFINDEIKGPNRIVLTAARPDRTSFGCSPDTRYTYWDGCVLSELPNSNNWPELYEKVNACVTQKESQMGVIPSEPQAFFGENTSDWTILH